VYWAPALAHARPARRAAGTSREANFTALVANVADPKTFRSGRSFSAWIGLMPRQHSSGGRDILGSISKQVDRNLRSFVRGCALAVIRLWSGNRGPRDFASYNRCTTIKFVTVMTIWEMSAELCRMLSIRYLPVARPNFFAG
jgi:hypothetical protein